MKKTNSLNVKHPNEQNSHENSLLKNELEDDLSDDHEDSVTLAAGKKTRKIKRPGSRCFPAKRKTPKLFDRIADLLVVPGIY